MARRLPSLNALKAFEAAARHGSFTKAAEELHVTHAAISRHVRELEAWLQVDLFRRVSRGVVVTEVGESYRRTLTEVFDRLLAATQEVAAGSAGRGLKVSVEPAFAARWLVPRLGSFQARHPGIDLALDSSNRLVDFRSDDADLAIRYGQGNWQDVDLVCLSEVRCFPVCSPGLLQGPLPASPEVLREHTLLHEETRSWWGEWLAEAGVEGVDHTRGPLLQDTHLALEAAAAGQGFALGDSILAADDLADGWLVKPFTGDILEGGYYLVQPKHVKETAPRRAFREWLQAEMTQFLAGAEADVA
jgi:LysR family glycine cleavage system transcriptional activator